MSAVGSPVGVLGKAEPPAWFVCPISMEVMKTPVVLLETGQVFERDAVTEWLQVRRTCPTTGVQLTDAGIAPVHGLRRAIEDWSERTGDPDAAPRRSSVEKSTPEGWANGAGRMYSVGHLCAIVGAEGGRTQEGVRAIEKLNDMLSVGFVQASVIKAGLPQLTMVDSRVEDLGGMQEGLAELRFRLFKERMQWREKLLMLRCKGVKLREQILSWYGIWANNKRCRLMAAAKILSGLGDTELERLRDSLIEIACPLRSDVHSKGKDGAVLLLAALLIDSTTRPHFTTGCVGGALLRYCASNTNSKVQSCAVKGIQKMCATGKGRRIISASTALDAIVSLLPSAENSAGYGARVYSGVFSRSTLVETIVKLLHLVVEEPDGVDGLVQCGAISALNEVSWSLKLDHGFERKHLDPLLETLLGRLALQRASQRALQRGVN